MQQGDIRGREKTRGAKPVFHLNHSYWSALGGGETLIHRVGCRLGATLGGEEQEGGLRDINVLWVLRLKADWRTSCEETVPGKEESSLWDVFLL